MSVELTSATGTPNIASMAGKTSGYVRWSAFVAVLLSLGIRVTSAQDTVFSYQGSLRDNGAPANGVYDLQFTVHDALTDGNAVGAVTTVEDVSVTNGLFIVAVNPGSGVFTGGARWIEVGVRPGTSTDTFTILTPRQPITSTPYAIFAGGVNGAGVTGAIPAASIGSGTITSNMLAPGAAAANLAASGQGSVPSGAVVFSNNNADTNLIAAGYLKLGVYVTAQNLWSVRPASTPLAPRTGHAAVWTGISMIVWSGYCGNKNPNFPPPIVHFNDGAIYDPAVNIWSLMTTNGAPLGRKDFSSVWSGTEMIVWGGFTYNGAYNYYNDGGRFNSLSNSWSPIPTNSAPSPRQLHSAIWTGTEMIVWGGVSSSANGVQLTLYNDGARYNPASNAWLSLSSNGAPSPRMRHTVVWTGAEMIVWGGRTSFSGTGVDAADGARYNPAADTWTPVNSTNAPGPRSGHSAVWTGAEMIVWGGLGDNEGGRYNPTTDSWSLLDSSFAPASRFLHSTVWTGREMIVWGGEGGGARNDGGSYDPAANAWTPLAIAPRAPERRKRHTAVWTGSEMIVFGGDVDNTPCFGDLWSCTPPKLLYLYSRP